MIDISIIDYYTAGSTPVSIPKINGALALLRQLQIAKGKLNDGDPFTELDRYPPESARWIETHGNR